MKEILINKKDNLTTIAIIENGVLVEKYTQSDENARLEESIYIGKIQNILEGMQSAFVDIGEKKNTYIHIKDLMPKVNIIINPNGIEKRDIRDIAKVGQNLLVQVKRDKTGSKGAKVSTHISIPSRYIVLMPDTDIITISQKIEDENERERLLRIVKSTLKKGYGAIIRTSCENKNEEKLKEDIQKTITKWEKIKKEYSEKTDKKIGLIYKADSFIKKTILDLIDEGIAKIITNSKSYYEEIKKIIEEEKENNIDLILKEEDILELYCINSQIEKTMQRKIWLKCGGFITIDKTEALTAIDVNSGKYIGKSNLEETLLKVNLEATEEIVNQIILRDIGGIIIIDYIDMPETEDKDRIIQALQKSLKRDRSKTQVIGFTKLNLLEMTRKHMKGEN